MRYLAININYKLDQDWYCRCASVLGCNEYFDSLGPGHGPRVAIYDTEENKYLWIGESHDTNSVRLNEIVSKAIQKIKAHSFT